MSKDLKRLLKLVVGVTGMSAALVHAVLVLASQAYVDYFKVRLGIEYIALILIGELLILIITLALVQSVNAIPGPQRKRKPARRRKNVM